MGSDEALDRIADTARWTAAERARESEREDRLFSDPLAGVLAGDRGRALAERMRAGGLFDSSGFVVRTRFYDDTLADALTVRAASSQVVALAAGMDARPFRLDLAPDLIWFELDRPELLALKGRLLDDVGAAPRCLRRPVGVDLTADWAAGLLDAGFERSRPTMWLAEGLVFYLEPDAVHRLFDDVTALSAPGSELLTDTIGVSMLDSPYMRPWCERLAEEGTPWLFGTDHPEDDLFAPRGWSADAALYPEVGTRLGRWPGPSFPRDTPGVPQSFLIHAVHSVGGPG